MAGKRSLLKKCFERRNRDHQKMLAALMLYCLVWFVAVAHAADGSSVFDGWTLFLSSLGIIQVLIGYIYVTGINSLKSQNSALFRKVDDLEKTKMNKDDHAMLCARVNDAGHS